MESIYRLVSDSMARHRVETNSPVPLLPDVGRSGNAEPHLDHLRLEWSKWFRCESSFSVLLVPAKPGIFALGEEMVPAASDMPALSGVEESSPVQDMRSKTAEQRVAQGFQPCINATSKNGALAPEVPGPAGKRMLALFQISEADDLGMALGRLFLPGNPLLAKLNSGRCFTRYAVIEDAAERSDAYAVFQCWMQESAESASGIQKEPCGSDIPVRAEANKDVKPDSELVQAVPPSISSAWGAGFLDVQNRETSPAVRRPAPLPSGF